MPMTNIWNEFGPSIQGSPKMTLAAFLGDEESIAECKKQGIGFPLLADFDSDSVYDPNPYNLKLDTGLLGNNQLVLCLMTWGKEPIFVIANACAQLQCACNKEPDPAINALQVETASAVKSYVQEPTTRIFGSVKKLVKACRELYSPYEDDPDSEEARIVWYQLGAPWFAAETICNDWEIQSYDGTPPPEAQSTWIKRNSMWTKRAVDSAAEWSSHERVNDEMRKTALKWALSS